jgi:hypothetical protein
MCCSAFHVFIDCNLVRCLSVCLCVVAAAPGTAKKLHAVQSIRWKNTFLLLPVTLRAFSLKALRGIGDQISARLTTAFEWRTTSVRQSPTILGTQYSQDTCRWRYKVWASSQRIRTILGGIRTLFLLCVHAVVNDDSANC